MSEAWSQLAPLGVGLLLLLLLLFWLTGAYRRLRRLQQQAQSSFTPVAQQFEQALALLEQTQQQADKTPLPARPALQALAPSADTLGRALTQLRANPLHAASAAQLDGEWRSLQSAWQAYLRQVVQAVQGSSSASSTTPSASKPSRYAKKGRKSKKPAATDLILESDTQQLTTAAPREDVQASLPYQTVQLAQAWYNMHTVLLHHSTPFNQAVEAYNQAIAQKPAAWLAHLLGMAAGQGLSTQAPLRQPGFAQQPLSTQALPPPTPLAPAILEPAPTETPPTP